MSLRNVVYAVLLTIAILGIYRCGSDPRRTRLPFGTTDLSSVQEALSKLPPDERELVENYVKRSNGDVVPASIGDPDNPLTARTFAEAIELERDSREKMREQEARAAARRAELDARLAPLRALVRAEVAKAEVLTRGEWLERQYPGSGQGADPTPLFLVTIRLSNLGEQPVTALHGSLQARDSREYLPLDLCWIETREDQTVPPGASLEIVCGGRPGVSDQERAFAAGTPGRFRLEWMPQYIRLADGREYEVRI